MRLTATPSGLVAEVDGETRALPVGVTLDALLAGEDALARATEWFVAGTPTAPVAPGDARAPIGNQEVWAAGVTYRRSREARAAESAASGSDMFYDRVYDADRPELFFKATPHRVVGPGEAVRIRGDSTWNVPEPELALVLDVTGKIVGHTIGNDMSSRSIEGENPLYLPQAKVYAGCCALGPAIVLGPPPDASTAIAMSIHRRGDLVFAGDTTVAAIKRDFADLAGWLFRADTFPNGAFLLTGTGIVPPDDFTLEPGDVVSITIEPIGTLVNHVDVV